MRLLDSSKSRFSLKRAKKLGYIKATELIEKEWQLLRSNYHLSEEYFGYVIDDYEEIIDDMIVQTEPYEWCLNDLTPVKFLNLSWEKFFENPETYPQCEQVEIEKFLASSFNQSLTVN